MFPWPFLCIFSRGADSRLVGTPTPREPLEVEIGERDMAVNPSLDKPRVAVFPCPREARRAFPVATARSAPACPGGLALQMKSVSAAFPLRFLSGLFLYGYNIHLPVHLLTAWPRKKAILGECWFLAVKNSPGPRRFLSRAMLAISSTCAVETMPRRASTPPPDSRDTRGADAPSTGDRGRALTCDAGVHRNRHTG